MNEWSGTCPKCNHVPPPAPTRLCVMHEAREQAIRDCIAVVEDLRGENPNVLPRWFKRDALAALRALLDKP